jgi:16S rRNA processing protein RimM
MPQPPAGASQEKIPVGRVRRAVGLKGELSVTAYGDDPARFKPGTVLEIRDLEYTVLSARQGPRSAILLMLEGVSDPDAAAQLRDAEILVEASVLPQQPDGVYYYYQLIGLAVRTVDGHGLGSVSEIMETGGNDVYVVKADSGQETLIPAVKEVVVDIDLAAGTMTIDPPPGLIP